MLFLQVCLTLLFAAFVPDDMAYAATPLQLTGKYETKSTKLLSNGTTGDGISYRTFALIAELSGGIEGVQEYLVIQEYNNRTGNATSSGWGTFSGKIGNNGPGKAVFSFISTTEAFGTPRAKLQGKFWLERGTGPLEGYNLVGNFQGTSPSGGTYEAEAIVVQQVVERVSPITYVGIVAGVLIAAAGIAIGVRNKSSQSPQK